MTALAPIFRQKLSSASLRCTAPLLNKLTPFFAHNFQKRNTTQNQAEHANHLPFQVFHFFPQGQPQLVEKKRSAVIVLQEWWGINQQIKNHAHRIADGTETMSVIPDLYKGKIGLSQQEASHLMNDLDWKQAVEELTILVDQLRQDNYTHIASIGFCMGGALSLALAAKLSTTRTPLAAAITCYGIPPPSLCDLSTVAVKTPVQAHFGNEDKTIGFSDVNAAKSLERQLLEGIELYTTNTTGEAVEIYHYDGQGHAFLNDEEWSRQLQKEMGYVGGDDKEIQDLAWQRIFKFLKTYLF